MNEKKQKILMAVLIVAALLFAGAGYFLLPDVLIVQITSSGAGGRTLPKLPGLLIPLIVTVVFALRYGKSGESRSLLVAVIGLLADVVMFVANR